jgi:hypothetical protein
MYNFIDLTNKKFGKLLIIKSEFVKNEERHWLCRCDCGNEKIISGHSLRRGATISCGCHKIKHGYVGTKLYNVFSHMKARCYNKNSKFYNYYGGRGIKICDEWLINPLLFFKWAEKNGYDEKLSIDRIDNNGDYSPDNCRWATKKQQANNRNYCILITYKSKTQTLKMWCDELNMSWSTVKNRIKKYGYIDYIFTKPIGRYKW